MKKTKNKAKMVSIIVLNWNGIDFTKKCIESIRQITTYPSYEIIVVDNGSRENDVDELKQMEKKRFIDKLILNPENIGFSKANNQGIKAARGDYFLLLNNDTIVTENWLHNLVEVAESSEDIGIVGPNLPPYDNPGICYGGGYVDDSGIARHMYNTDERDVEQVGGAALFFKKELIEKIGLLDEGFSPIYFEETDFCARAHRAGHKVIFTPKSRVIHFEGSTIKKQTDKWLYVTMNKNRLRFMLLHFPKSRLVKAIPWELLRIAKNVFTMKVHWLMRAYWITLKDLKEILEKRNRYALGDLRPNN